MRTRAHTRPTTSDVPIGDAVDGSDVFDVAKSCSSTVTPGFERFFSVVVVVRTLFRLWTLLPSMFASSFVVDFGVVVVVDVAAVVVVVVVVVVSTF